MLCCLLRKHKTENRVQKRRTGMDKKLLFIVNPRAGRTKSFAPLFDAVACFSKAGYLVKVFLTEGRGDATRAAAELGGAYDLVVCAGGDGTYWVRC